MSINFNIKYKCLMHKLHSSSKTVLIYIFLLLLTYLYVMSSSNLA